MTDVSKIQGPSGSPETPGKKDKAAADADKFQEAMRKRVTEVSQVDPDEQKKRKRGEEAEEEDETMAGPQAGPTTPAELVTPFSMEQEAKKASPLDLQKGGPGISPMESAQPTQAQLPSPPKTAFFQAPATDEMSDDSGMLEEESFGVGASAPSEEPGQQAPYVGAQETPEAQSAPPPDAQAQQANLPQPQQQQQGQPGGWTPEGQQPVTPGPPESSGQQTGQQPQGQKPGMAQGGPPGEKKGAVPGMAPKIASPLKEEQQKQAAASKMGTLPQKPAPGLTAAALEGTQTSKVQDTSGFFEQLGKEGEGQGQGQKGKKGAEGTEEGEEEAAVQGAGAPAQPTPFAQALEGQVEKQVEGKEKTSSMEMTDLPTGTAEAQVMAAPPPGPEALPPYANLNPQVQDLFDRMVGVMTVMNMSGMTETVITLNSPQFASSVFFGTQIIIQEFSTAPQAFNIQLNGSAQAVALFQGNADDLMAAFQSGNYNFRINRLETGYLSERPLFKRKEKAGGDNKDQTGDSPQ